MSDEPLFDPEETKPIPAGTYSARIMRAEIKTSRAGNKYLACDMQILQGAQQGRALDANFHIFSTDTKFRADSRRKLARLASSCGIVTVMKPEELVDKPFLVEIGETTDNYGATNLILGYSKLGRG